MTHLKSIAVLMLAALVLPDATVQAEERLEFCSFETPYPDQNVVVSGGSKSWSLKTHFGFRVPEGVKADFRGIDPYWGHEDFSYYGEATISFSSDGGAIFRSEYLFTQDDPRLPVEKYLESQGKPLILAMTPEEEGGQHIAISRLTSQMTSDNIYLFAIIEAAQVKPLRDRLEAALPFTLVLGTDGLLLATSDTLTIANIAEMKAEGEADFARMQADAEAKTCM